MNHKNQINNNQNMIKQNNNLNMNKSNDNKNFKRKIHKPNFDGSIIAKINQIGSINRNEANQILYIIETSQPKGNSNLLTNTISSQLKKQFKGEWFVLVSDINQNLVLNISTLNENDYLIIQMGKSLFKIAKLG